MMIDELVNGCVSYKIHIFNMFSLGYSVFKQFVNDIFLKILKVL